MKKQVAAAMVAAATLQGCMGAVSRADETNIQGFSDSMLCRGVLYAHQIATHPLGLSDEFYMRNVKAVPLYLEEIERRNAMRPKSDPICMRQYTSVKSVWNS